MKIDRLDDLPEAIRDRIQAVFDQKVKISKRVTNGVMLTLLLGEIMVSEDYIRDKVLLIIENQYKVVLNRTWFYEYYQYKGAADE